MTASALRRTLSLDRAGIGGQTWRRVAYCTQARTLRNAPDVQGTDVDVLSIHVATDPDRLDRLDRPDRLEQMKTPWATLSFSVPHKTSETE